MERKGLLLVVSGPSGAGKGTVCEEFKKIHPHIRTSISATTREPRTGEVDGESYFFVSRQEFEEMVQKDELLEHVFVFENFYGTPKPFVLKHLEKGHNVLLEIEIEGAMKVKRKYPEAIMIFILAPSMEELKNRITNRATEEEEQIRMRMSRAINEIRNINEYNYFIINEDPEKSAEELYCIITAEQNKVSRYHDEILERFHPRMNEGK